MYYKNEIGLKFFFSITWQEGVSKKNMYYIATCKKEIRDMKVQPLND